MKYLSSLLMMSLSSGALADDSFIQWHDTSITALYGSSFEVDPEDQTTFTLEHVNGHKWGDFFMFVDQVNFRGSDVNDSTYGEFSPRFSVSKIFDTKASWGIVQDVLLTTTYETGKGDVESFLYGPAIDLAIPHFNFFQLNFYKRDPNNNDSEGWQVTPAWSASFPFMSSQVIVDGYIDWVFNSDDDNYEENFHFNPQIKYDLGMQLWGEASKGKLLIGIEYDYWTNKYGITDKVPFDVDQSAYSFMIQYHL